MFTDTHCHIYDEYYDNIDDVYKKMLDKKVNRVINNGVGMTSNKEVLDKISKYDFMYGAIGIHPEEVDTYTLDDLKFIEDHIHDDKVVAIGEIGLDYHWTKENRDEQIKLFEAQLEIASRENVPVIIHSRDATLDTINILKKYNVRGVIHSFSGSLETANIYIKMGFLLGINGVVTFKNCKLKEVLKDISLDNIVLETDSPYLTPTPFRGEKNNPSYVLNIAEFLCDVYDVSLDEIANITNKNIERCYKI